MRKVVALSLLLVAIAVAACNIVPGIVTPVVKIGQWDSLRDKWEKIGDRLDEMFGQSFKNDEILQVRVPVRACVLGVCAVSADVSFIKPCGKSFKEAAYEISTRAPGGGGDAGGGRGGGWVTAVASAATAATGAFHSPAASPTQFKLVLEPIVAGTAT